MESNTYATSSYIDAPLDAVRAYLTDGMSLNEYTLFSRMQEQVNPTTWRGTASGYQAGLYYHVRHRQLDDLEVVEWHCGATPDAFFHVYPMFLFAPRYFGGAEAGTYYHWISFVDPARRTQMIAEGLPTVHRSEARSLKAQLERRAGHRRAVAGALALQSHTIFVDAPAPDVAAYLASDATVTEWGYLMRRDGARLYDEYDRPIEVRLRRHDLGAYELVEHDTHYVETGHVVRTPMAIVPCAYAFAQPAARGVILHRVSAWPAHGEREVGKQAGDDYDTEAINAKRILEAQAGNLATYARGVSYQPVEG